MKISDITEAYIAEKPVGMIQRGLDKAKKLVPGDTRQRAIGKDNANKTANHLWKYYQQQLGQSGEQPSTENLRNFFMQKPYNVDQATIDAAFKAAGITEGMSEASYQDRLAAQSAKTQAQTQSQDSMSMLQKNLQKGLQAATPSNYYDDPEQEPEQQQGPQPVSKKQAEQVFMHIVQKAPQNFAAGNQNSIPSDVIDAVKKLKPAQRQTLGKTLLGQQTNV